MSLKSFEVEHEQRHFGVEPLGARQLARQVREHEARVRQAGQRVGERRLVRLLEDDGVVDHGRGLLADAIEQPAMIVAVEARRV